MLKRGLIAIGLSSGAPAWAATAASALPPGTYTINGVATSSSSSFYCPVKKGQAFTGTVAFPGDGKQAFEITYAGLNANGDIKQVRFYAFPTVPDSGLNGWSDKHPAGTDVEQFKNGKDISGVGNTGSMAFNLQPFVDGSTIFVGGKMAVEIVTSGSCQQGYTILLQRVGRYTGDD